MSFNHIGVSVRDIDASIDFYREMLGLEPQMEIIPFRGKKIEAIMDIPDVTGRMCMIGKGSLQLELFEFTNSQPRDPNYPVSDGGYTHFGVMVEDIDATYDKLEKAGVPIHCPIIEFEGGMRAAYCRDPDGNVFEIMQQGPVTQS